MSTPAQPPNPQQPNAQPGAFQPAHLGGTLVMPAPLPNIRPYLLVPEAFLTLRDGEMSEVRSLRDISIGAFVAGLVAIASQLSTIDWDLALKQGRHPVAWTIVLFSITGVAFGAAVITQLLNTHMRARSAYSRQIETIENYFGIEPVQHGLLSRLWGFFTRRPVANP